jgi:hypothetical protein
MISLISYHIELNINGFMLLNISSHFVVRLYFSDIFFCLKSPSSRCNGIILSKNRTGRKSASGLSGNCRSNCQIGYSYPIEMLFINMVIVQASIDWVYIKTSGISSQTQLSC